MSKPKRDTDSKQSIQTLFLQPRDSYELREVARLTDIPVRALRREVARGDYDATKVRGQWRFAWRQAVCVALQRWTLAEIHHALGDDSAGILPPLLALRRVTVRLPEYVLLALETCAADRGTTLDHYLYSELIDFAGTMSDHLGHRIPGYRLAYFYPDRR